MKNNQIEILKEKISEYTKLSGGVKPNIEMKNLDLNEIKRLIKCLIIRNRKFKRAQKIDYFR